METGSPYEVAPLLEYLVVRRLAALPEHASPDGRAVAWTHATRTCLHKRQLDQDDLTFELRGKEIRKARRAQPGAPIPHLTMISIGPVRPPSAHFVIALPTNPVLMPE